MGGRIGAVIYSTSKNCWSGGSGGEALFGARSNLKRVDIDVSV